MLGSRPSGRYLGQMTHGSELSSGAPSGGPRDAHAHPGGWAQTARSLSLRIAISPVDFIAIVLRLPVLSSNYYWFVNSPH